MGLFERIKGEGQDPKISIHSFVAAMAEIRRGQMTLGQAQTLFVLDAGEQTEALAVLNALNALTFTERELKDVLYMVESEHDPYDTVAKVKTRLGF